MDEQYPLSVVTWFDSENHERSDSYIWYEVGQYQTFAQANRIARFLCKYFLYAQIVDHKSKTCAMLQTMQKTEYKLYSISEDATQYINSLIESKATEQVYG